MSEENHTPRIRILIDGEVKYVCYCNYIELNALLLIDHKDEIVRRLARNLQMTNLAPLCSVGSIPDRELSGCG